MTDMTMYFYAKASKQEAIGISLENSRKAFYSDDGGRTLRQLLLVKMDISGDVETYVAVDVLGGSEVEIDLIHAGDQVIRNMSDCFRRCGDRNGDLAKVARVVTYLPEDRPRLKKAA